ncbi:MYB family transcription factor [Klebsormidium nitens]|uniref:MYB family transcription factor n=1 Tax=Klebsormidium nitens TaxID=105231 RepID=A0A1Y1HNX9_KLENI|nr:MYB family transcription factor [Klebsormidium nitens]|eukprot:GAQ79733.1 MYB family transcription factor [Klebsormidium nitens]
MQLSGKMDLGPALPKASAAEEAAALDYLVDPLEEVGEERAEQQEDGRGVNPTEDALPKEGHQEHSPPSGPLAGVPLAHDVPQPKAHPFQDSAEPGATEIHAILPARGNKRQRNPAEKEEGHIRRARPRPRREELDRVKGRRMDISPLPLRLLVRSAVYEDITVVVPRDANISQLKRAIEEQSNSRLKESFSPTLLFGKTPLNKDSLTLKQVGIVQDDTIVGFLARDTRALIESAGLLRFHELHEIVPTPTTVIRPSPTGEAAARALVGLGNVTAEGYGAYVSTTPLAQPKPSRRNQSATGVKRKSKDALGTFSLPPSVLNGPQLDPSQLPPGYCQVSAAELLMRGLAAASKTPASRNAKRRSPSLKPPSAPPAQTSPSQTDANSTATQDPTLPASETTQTAEVSAPQISVDLTPEPHSSPALAPTPQPAADVITAPEPSPESASEPPNPAIPTSDPEVIPDLQTEPQSSAIDAPEPLPATATPSAPEPSAPLVESSAPESSPDPPSQDPQSSGALIPAGPSEEHPASAPQSTEPPIPAPPESGAPQDLPATTPPQQEPTPPTSAPTDEPPSFGPSHDPPSSTPFSEAPQPPVVVDDDDDWEARARAAAMRGNAPAPGGAYEIVKMERPADSSLGQDDGDWDKVAQQMALRGNHWLEPEAGTTERYVAMRPPTAVSPFPPEIIVTPSSEAQAFETPMPDPNATGAPPMRASGASPPADVIQSRIPENLDPGSYHMPNETQVPAIDPNGIPDPEGLSQLPYATAYIEQGYEAATAANEFAPPGTEEAGGMMVDDGQQWQLALSEPKQEKSLKQKHPTGDQRRARRLFTVGEVEALVTAVERLGTGRWRDVKQRAFPLARHRTYADLKDKWKTLVRTAQIAPSQRRGVEVPEDLLERVTRAHFFWRRQAEFDERYAAQYAALPPGEQGDPPYAQGPDILPSYPGQDPPPPIVEEVQDVPGDGTGTERNGGPQAGDYQQVLVSSPGADQAHPSGGVGSALETQEGGREKQPSDLGPLDLGYAPGLAGGFRMGRGNDAQNDQGTGEGYQNGAEGGAGSTGTERGVLQSQGALEARGPESEAENIDATVDGALAVEVQAGSKLPGLALETKPYVPSSGVESLRAAYDRQVSMEADVIN